MVYAIGVTLHVALFVFFATFSEIGLAGSALVSGIVIWEPILIWRAVLIWKW